MNALDSIKAGRLLEARKLLIDGIKSSPADSGKRTLLFQVLMFLGEWDKAGRHLETIALQDSDRVAGVQTYRDLLAAEKERTEVITLNHVPSFLPEAPVYFDAYYAGLQKLNQEDIEKAKGLFDKANVQRAPISGTVNGKSFIGFADTNTFLSPFLEAIVHERYVWIPFDAIRELIIPSPKTLLDLLWTQASITTWEGLTMNCFLPVLYPGSADHEDERIKLGRMTDWIPLGGTFSKAVGQHVYQIGNDEMALLEIRDVQFNFDGPQEAGETID